ERFARHARGGDAPGGGAAGRRLLPGAVQGHRARHVGGAAGEPLPPLPVLLRRRHRDRHGDRLPHRPGARRRPEGRQPPRGRDDDHGRAADRRGLGLLDRRPRPPRGGPLMSAHRLLIADDEEGLLDFLSLLFQQEGYEVETALSAEAARKALAARSYDLVLCDILMPDGNGLDILKEIKAGNPNAAVIMMTAYTSTKSAIEAMRLGAYDYISKPFDVEELKIVAQKALEKAELVDENVYLRRELEQKYTFNNIIGKSPRMQAIFALIDRVARTSSTVLIHGESGTGKEL